MFSFSLAFCFVCTLFLSAFSAYIWFWWLVIVCHWSKHLPKHVMVHLFSLAIWDNAKQVRMTFPCRSHSCHTGPLWLKKTEGAWQHSVERRLLHLLILVIPFSSNYHAVKESKHFKTVSCHCVPSAQADFSIASGIGQDWGPSHSTKHVLVTYIIPYWGGHV